MSTRDSIVVLLSAVLIVSVACHPQKKASHAKAPAKSTVAKSPTKNAPVVSSSEFANKLQIAESDVRKNKLYQFSESWYGVPYRYGGCDKKGVDCSCFTSLLYQEVFQRSVARTSQDLFKASDQIELQDAQQGDLVFFKIGGNSITHVGVYLKGSYFIHASTSKGVIINSLEEAYYKKYFFSAGKIRNS